MRFRALPSAIVPIVVVVVVACTKEPSPGAPPSRCTDFPVAYDNAVTRASNACSTDDDCKCYPGGVSPNHACGYVTDKATAAVLESLAKDFNARHCEQRLACAAWRCAPVCRGGRCANNDHP